MIISETSMGTFSTIEYDPYPISTKNQKKPNSKKYLNDTLEYGIQTFKMNRECLFQQIIDKTKILKKEISLKLYISRTKFRITNSILCPDDFEPKIYNKEKPEREEDIDL